MFWLRTADEMRYTTYIVYELLANVTYRRVSKICILSTGNRQFCTKVSMKFELNLDCDIRYKYNRFFLRKTILDWKLQLQCFKFDEHEFTAHEIIKSEHNNKEAKKAASLYINVSNQPLLNIFRTLRMKTTSQKFSNVSGRWIKNVDNRLYLFDKTHS